MFISLDQFDANRAQDGPSMLCAALLGVTRRAGRWLRFVDVHPEEAALDLFLFRLHLIDQLLRNTACDIRVDRSQRRTTFRHHAKVF